jgi:hypothetical protein
MPGKAFHIKMRMAGVKGLFLSQKALLPSCHEQIILWARLACPGAGAGLPHAERVLPPRPPLVWGILPRKNAAQKNLQLLGRKRKEVRLGGE